MGPLCSLCVDGSRKGVTGVCEECPKADGGEMTFYFFMLALAGAFVVTCILFRTRIKIAFKRLEHFREHQLQVKLQRSLVQTKLQCGLAPVKLQQCSLIQTKLQCSCNR